MDEPTEEHHLKDLGSTEATDPTEVDAVDPDAAPAGPDAPPSPETFAGTLGLEGSADNPTGDDRFAGDSR